MKLYKQVKRRGMYVRRNDYAIVDNRCEVFGKGCANCDAHLYKLFHGRFPIFWETLDQWRDGIIYKNISDDECSWESIEGLAKR